MTVQIPAESVTHICAQINSFSFFKEHGREVKERDFLQCSFLIQAVIIILLMALNNNDAHISYLEELKAMLEKMAFGSRSEKTEVCAGSEEQKDNTENKSTEAASDQQESSAPVKKVRRFAGLMKKTVASMVVKWLDINGNEVDEDNEEDKKTVRLEEGEQILGYEVREYLRFIPAKIIRIRQRVLRVMSKKDGKIKIRKVGKLLPSLFEKGSYNPEPGLLAHIIFEKYGNSMPVNRQTEDLKRIGIVLKRGTVNSWLNVIAEKYMPGLMVLFLEMQIRGIALQMDETVGNQQKRGIVYLWQITSIKYVLRKIVLFVAADGTRNGDNAVKLLRDYCGYLMTDAFAGYNKLKMVLHAFCTAHARRKFVEALPPDKEKARDSKAFEFVELFNRIFKLEADYQELSISDREQKRRENITPIMAEIRRKCEEVQKDKTVSKKSKLMTAVNYFMNHRDEFNTFFQNGYVPIHNQLCENNFKSVKLGLKNYLTFGSDRGRRTAAVFYSLIHTAQANHLDPEKYLEYILTRMFENKGFVEANDREFLSSLLPWNEDVMKTCVDRIHESQFTDEYIAEFQKKIVEEEAEMQKIRAEIEKTIEARNAAEEEEKMKEAQKKKASKKKKAAPRKKADKAVDKAKKELADYASDEHLENALKELSPALDMSETSDPALTMNVTDTSPNQNTASDPVIIPPHHEDSPCRSVRQNE